MMGKTLKNFATDQPSLRRLRLLNAQLTGLHHSRWPVRSEESAPPLPPIPSFSRPWALPMSSG